MHAVNLDDRQARALDLVRSGKRFVLSGHERPDGDCIGAQAALARGLEAMGKEVFILNPDPPEPQFDYLSSVCKYGTYKGGDVPAHDVHVLLDASELSRCGALGEKIRAASSKKLVVDHHIHVGDDWWDEAFVDTSASATGLLVYRMMRALEVELDETMALGVFTSMVTDTGWFKYSNTDAETLGVASELVTAGVDPSTVFQKIYQRESSGLPQSVGRVLRTVEYHGDKRLAIARVEKPGPGEEALTDSDLVLDILRSVDTIEVVLVVRATDEGKCKLSARAKGDFDVSALARQFGGGGHKKAAGATMPYGLDESCERLVAAALSALAAGGAA